ncbi:MAG: hypothetical protein AB1330_01310 [Bacillota bacterium]
MTFPRVDFKDGLVYHDYHFNGMQYEIAKEIKQKDLINYYDLRLINSDYQYSFIEPAVDKSRCDTALTSAHFDTNGMVITTSELGVVQDWYSVSFTPPAPTVEFYLYADVEKPADTDVVFEVGDGTSYTVLVLEQPLSLAVATIKLRIGLTASSVDKPRVYNYCLMWR